MMRLGDTCLFLPTHTTQTNPTHKISSPSTQTLITKNVLEMINCSSCEVPKQAASVAFLRCRSEQPCVKREEETTGSTFKRIYASTRHGMPTARKTVDLGGVGR